MTGNPVELLDACLPQTQCTRCSYPCCMDYATAIDKGEAGINQCPPGGEVTIRKLAALTGLPAVPLDPEFGDYQPKTLAYIHEDRCIGCVLCIQACPVDAIVGANKLMHTVIQSQCTGCELCLPVCPTDCIDMQAPGPLDGPESDWPGYTQEDIEQGRRHFQRRQQRLARRAQARPQGKLDPEARQRAILEAVKRKQQQKK